MAAELNIIGAAMVATRRRQDYVRHCDGQIRRADGNKWCSYMQVRYLHVKDGGYSLVGNKCIDAVQCILKTLTQTDLDSKLYL